ncbi:MAG: hypothetical protein AB1780_06300 [Pseudomonadota bacterium]
MVFKVFFQGLGFGDILSLSSLIVALSALFFTIWQFSVQRKHNRISVKPHLIKFSRRSKSNNVAKLEILLINNGLGPAYINKFQVFYKGEEIEPNNAVKNALGPLIENMSITILGDDYAIAEKETVKLLSVTFPCNTELDIDIVAKNLDEMDLLIEYSSAYEKMPNLDTRRL